MKQTQAQVEAAATKIRKPSCWDDACDIARAALTAAAEIGKQNIGSEAGVCATHVLRDKETIERCAQVAECWHANGLREGGPVAIADAIRALKDK